MNFFSVDHRDPAMEDFEYHLRTVLPEHFNCYLGGEPIVLHELYSDYMHIDLFIWPPTPQRDLWTVVTSGMSAHVMKTPHHSYVPDRVELVLTLPKTWPSLNQIHQLEQDTADQYMWPFQTIKTLARTPYLNNTWLGNLHTTVVDSGTGQTYPGTGFSGIMLAPLRSLPEEANKFTVKEHQIQCLGLYPLYPQELSLILEQKTNGGAHDTYRRFIEADIHEGIFPQRQQLT